MENDQEIYRIVGNLEGDMRAIKDLLEVANNQRQEFQSDIKTAVTEMQTYIPMVIAHEKWINEDGKQAVEQSKHLKWMGAGAIGFAGLGSAPAWLPRLLDGIRHMFV